MHRQTKLLIGAGIAALVPAFVSALGTRIGKQIDIVGLLGFTTLLYVPSLICVLVLGGGAVLVLSRYRFANFWTLLVGGFIGGVVVCTIILLGSRIPQVPEILISGGEGMGAALVFLIVLRCFKINLSDR